MSFKVEGKLELRTASMTGMMSEKRFTADRHTSSFEFGHCSVILKEDIDRLYGRTPREALVKALDRALVEKREYTKEAQRCLDEANMLDDAITKLDNETLDKLNATAG